MAKLKNQITLNLDDDSAELVQLLAEYYQRKPAELVRLLLVPVLVDQFAKIQRQAHPENAQPFRSL